jgi:hypothetical protein
MAMWNDDLDLALGIVVALGIEAIAVLIFLVAVRLIS